MQVPACAQRPILAPALHLGPSVWAAPVTDATRRPTTIARTRTHRCDVPAGMIGDAPSCIMGVLECIPTSPARLPSCLLIARQRRIVRDLSYSVRHPLSMTIKRS